MDGSEAAVTATTTTSYPNMNNHVHLHDQPSCKSLKVVTILSVMSSTIMSEDARDGDPAEPAVRQIRPAQG